jgi:multimeric flavodoxin WrbA
MIKILALSGSSRHDSLNQKLLDRAVLGAREAGAEVTPIRLSDFARRSTMQIGKLSTDFRKARKSLRPCSPATWAC